MLKIRKHFVSRVWQFVLPGFEIDISTDQGKSEPILIDKEVLEGAHTQTFLHLEK